jgi:hypothetical protein
MDKTLNTSCLQKPKAQTPQFIPDKPFIGSFRVKGKIVDTETGKVKQYNMKPAERQTVNKYLAEENREYKLKMSGRVDILNNMLLR